MINLINFDEMDDLLFYFHEIIFKFEKYVTAYYDVTWMELYLLRLLARREKMNVNGLAKSLIIENFQASRLITKLSNKGFIQKQGSIEDERVVFVSLTPKGEKLISSIKERLYTMIKIDLDELDYEKVKNAVEVIYFMYEKILIE